MLQGMSMMESNIRFKKEAAGLDVSAMDAEAEDGLNIERNVIGLADEDPKDEEALRNMKPLRGVGEWVPRLVKTECVGLKSTATPARKFSWPQYPDLETMNLRERIKLAGFGIKANTNLY